MSETVGWIVASRTTGYLLETKDHAAKIFDTQRDARHACPPMGAWQPVRLTYEEARKSLLDGSPFCFLVADCHRRFVNRVRNDPVNKAFVQLSLDPQFVRWRVSPMAGANPQPQPPAPAAARGPHLANHPPVKTVPPAPAPVETTIFNPSVLVPERHG